MTDSSARTRWRRPRTWIVLLVAAAALWLFASLALLGWHAKQASSALQAMTAQIAAGDPQAAAASIESARGDTAAVRSAVNTAPISALKVVPYFRTNLEAVSTFMQAAQEVLNAAAVTNELYARLSGSDGQGQAAFENGTINITALQGIEPQVAQIDEILHRADQHLQRVPADASPVLRDYVDEATTEVAGIQKGLRIYNQLRPDLPALLGGERPATYLVVFHNAGELFPGGGAALSTAVVQFDQGKLEVLEKGPVSPDFTNPAFPWDPVSRGPYYAETNAKDGFAWSNLHQDYRITGENMMRSWVATGHQPVDGVISLDPVALAAAVRATGPIQTELYGQITADNLVQKLFFEGYNEDAAAQQQRKAVNQQLIDEMLARMQNGNTALTIGRAIFATAPGHHIRVYLSDGRLGDVLEQARADGAQPDPQPDRIAFFTQNQNASKVDIFQTREVIHDVRMESDGSATVVQTAKVSNNARYDGGSLVQRVGYTTRWVFHWNIVFLPDGAQDVKIAANPGEIKVDPRVFTDVDGRKAVRVGRWMPPGDTSTITVSYRLPDGTFGGDGNLEYRAGVEYQLTTTGVDLTVNVSGPSDPQPLEGDWTVEGDTAHTRFTVTQPTVVALGFGAR